MDVYTATELAYQNGYAAGYKAATLEIEKLIRETLSPSIICESDEILTILNELKVKGEQK